MWLVASRGKIIYHGDCKATAVEHCSMHYPDGARLYKQVEE